MLSPDQIHRLEYVRSGDNLTASPASDDLTASPASDLTIPTAFGPTRIAPRTAATETGTDTAVGVIARQIRAGIFQIEYSSELGLIGTTFRYAGFDRIGSGSTANESERGVDPRPPDRQSHTHGHKHADDARGLKELSSLLQGGTKTGLGPVQSFPLTRRAADGPKRVLFWASAPLASQTDMRTIGQLVQSVLSGHDASSVQLGRFITHELKNPLTAMLREASWLSNALQNPAPAALSSDTESSDTNSRDTDNAITQLSQQVSSPLTSPTVIAEGIAAEAALLLEQVDDITTLTTGAAPGSETTDMTEAAQVAIGRHRTQLEEIGATVKLTALPRARLRYSSAVMIFTNLVSNAIKYHNPSVSPCIKISGNQVDDSIRIAFSDNGVGIAANQRFAVLEPGVQLSERSPGDGLGLTLVSALVEKASGHIDIDSSPGQGLTAWITLPAADLPE